MSRDHDIKEIKVKKVKLLNELNYNLNNKIRLDELKELTKLFIKDKLVSFLNLRTSSS
jgi:hypothetical protein